MDGQDRPVKPGKMYSAQEKQAFLNALEAWEGSDTAFAAQHGIQRATMYKCAGMRRNGVIDRIIIFSLHKPQTIYLLTQPFDWFDAPRLSRAHEYPRQR